MNADKETRRRLDRIRKAAEAADAARKAAAVIRAKR